MMPGVLILLRRLAQVGRLDPRADATAKGLFRLCWNRWCCALSAVGARAIQWADQLRTPIAQTPVARFGKVKARSRWTDNALCSGDLLFSLVD